MITDLSWYIAFALIVNGFFFGIGFALANAFLAWVGGLIASART